jgi:hypothetical protein
MLIEVGKRYVLNNGIVTGEMMLGAHEGASCFVAWESTGDEICFDRNGTAYDADGAGFDVKCEYAEPRQVQRAQPVPEVGKRYQMASGFLVDIVCTRGDGLFVGDIDMGDGQWDRAIFEPDGTSIKAPGYRLEKEVAPFKRVEVTVPLNVDWEAKAEPVMRKFATGATRNLDTNKLDYDGFFCPLVMKRFSEYMHSHRQQADGTLRDADNWQNGIPFNVYIKSLFRHFMDLRLIHKGSKAISPEDQHEITAEEALCAILFNAQGYLHELLKQNSKADSDV